MPAKNVNFELPRSNYRRLMPFNRFFVEHIDSLVVVHFGLLSGSGVLLDRYSAAIFQHDLDGQKESLMDYLGKIGAIGDAPPQWQPPASQSPVELFNHLAVTSNPRVAETNLNNVVVYAANNLRNTTGGTMPMDPVVMLRSSREAQQHLIKELYPNP